MAQIRQQHAYSNLRNNYCFEKKKIVENNLSICQFERKDSNIKGYLSKILPNSVAITISQSGRCVSRYQKGSNTNKIFAKEKLFNLLTSLIVFEITYIKFYYA
tara:strand:- start:740 stop:1048 length:309 start_codon:yes stop_codon:yes gene_type:complete